LVKKKFEKLLNLHAIMLLSLSYCCVCLRFCGGLIRDIKNRYSLYLSDIKDGLHVQCVASTVFLFFACITPIVTFGGLMGQKTDGYMVR
jgi:hypothetical protein